jgi:hypothetical protein
LIGHDVEANLGLLSAMLAQLDALLEGGEVTRRLVVNLGGRRSSVTMSIGIIVNLIDWLQGADAAMSPAERRERDRMAGEYARMRARKLPVFSALLARELNGHLDSWTWFVDDCVRGADECREDYCAEVWIRTRLQQLLCEARRTGADTGPATARLGHLDDRLRPMLVPAPYCGPAEERERRPLDEYWWLYGRPGRGTDDLPPSQGRTATEAR